MYERSKRRLGLDRTPKPAFPVTPGTAVLEKVNRKFLSRCRLLLRPQSPAPPDPPMRQREHNAVDASPSTTSTRPHERLDHAAPGAGNATSKEWAQELRSSMAESPASTASDTTGDPGPVSGGQRSLGFQEAEEAHGEEEEEGQDVCWELDGEELVTRVPMRRSSRLRASIRTRSPFRRHSWEPGKKFLREVDGDHERSVSLEGLEDANIEEAVQAVGWPARQGRDPRRTPITHSTGELESLLSLTEEESEEEDLLGISGAGMSGNMGGSVSGMNEALDEGSHSGLRVQEEVTAPSHGPEGRRKGDCTEQSDLDPRASTKAHRTVSFLKKMAGLTKSREKEKLKEREKEAKERETRITNGHLFNSITVSGNTLCYACNKSIIAKEAFICPNCNVTIHKSCKDTLSSCTKVKQKQLKAAQAKNNSALHNVSMRHKAPLGRERPSSAIYPSDSFRQSPLFSQLGSRRCRTPFQSLSKSVSTNNIGNLNDDTPLGIRRILSQSTDSLNMRNRTLSIESLIDEGAEVIYQQLMGDLETDEKQFEADSWSLAVETSFLQQHRKDVMKRQDVIYELIQTEVHHMRTLKIMSDIFRKGMLEELQMDRNTVDTMFPALDDLIEFHIQFLSRLLDRRKESLLPDSDKNFVINRLGDILVSQFSGQNAELMKTAYAQFCSRHTKAVKLYKELFTRDKRFQQFVRRMTRSSVLRRHGIQECILLVTQRITKYPVLIDRILHNTKGNEEDRRDLGSSLLLVKELITAVDQEVHECEKKFRLQDIYNRMDPKAVAAMHCGRQFRREDLIRRKLVHDGFVLWKTATGRFKDIQVLLLTDVLILLQEKDQRYSFPALEHKPAVIPLHKLIVRDIANQEKGMFLISAAAQIPEMYEIHTSSKDERTAWMRVVQQTVNVCPEMDDFSTEIETKEMLRELTDEIQQRDRGITELLEEKASLFLQVLQLRAPEDLALELGSRKLFRSESSDCPKGEKLVNDALREVQSLSGLMVDVCGTSGQSSSSSSVDQTPGGTENTSRTASRHSNGEQADVANVNGTGDLCRTDSLNGSGQDRNGNQLQVKSPNEEAILKLSRLSVLLHGLQAIVVKQDSILESQRQQLGEQKDRLARQNSRDSGLAEQERLRSLEQLREELVGLRRQHSLLQEEFQRCRKASEEKAQEVRVLEARLQESERRRAGLERQMEEWRQRAAGPEAGREAPASAEQRRQKKSHSRQFSLPSAQFSSLNANALQSSEQRRSSADETCLRATLSCEGSPSPWPGGCGQTEAPGAERWATPLRTGFETAEGGSEAVDCGVAQEGSPLPEEEEEEEAESGEESENSSPSSSEEAAELQWTQNIPDGSSSGQPAPGGDSLGPHSLTTAQPEEDEDDDLYY